MLEREEIKAVQGDKEGRWWGGKPMQTTTAFLTNYKVINGKQTQTSWKSIDFSFILGKKMGPRCNPIVYHKE